MFDRLETERLIIRPATEADVDDLVSMDADPEVMRFLKGGRPTSRPDVITWVEQSVDHPWIADDRATDEFLGVLAFHPITYEIGWRFRRAVWGRGLASEGARAIVDAAFSTLDAPRVWAQTMTVNMRSRRVMERCGMRFVRTFFADWHEAHPDWHRDMEGSDQGDVEYEILQRQWQARR